MEVGQIVMGAPYGASYKDMAQSGATRRCLPPGRPLIGRPRRGGNRHQSPPSARALSCAPLRLQRETLQTVRAGIYTAGVIIGVIIVIVGH